MTTGPEIDDGAYAANNQAEHVCRANSYVLRKQRLAVFLAANDETRARQLDDGYDPLAILEHDRRRTHLYDGVGRAACSCY